MTTQVLDLTATVMFPAGDPGEVNELVKGQLVRGEDARLLEQVGPLVRASDVTLDLSGVERIDAGGITALIELYQIAAECGHRFRVTNVSARVGQILAVVGLDRFLYSHNAVQSSQYGQRMRCAAA
jgi:anti-anti-sigma factor